MNRKANPRRLRLATASAVFAVVAAMAVAACSSSGGSQASSGASSSSSSSSNSAQSSSSSSAAPSSSGAPQSSASSAPESSGSAPGSSAFFTKVESEDAASIAAVKVDTAAQALLPTSVKSSGTLKVGTQISAPENFYAPGTTNLVGDEATLMRAIAAALGLKADFQVVQFDELIPGLTSKRFDTTIGAMNDTKARQATITFVDYYNAGIGIIVAKGNPKDVTGPDSFCGLNVNVQLGTTQEALAKSQSAKCTSEGKKAVNIIYAKTNAQQQAEVQSGRADVYLADSPTAAYVAGQNPDLFEQADASTAIEAAPYGIGFNKSNDALAKAVQEALNGLISGGTYGKIMQTWGLTSGALTTATINGGK